jgi:hypothetical protein
MINETMKALLMIAMFGTLEFALYFSRIREATVRVCRAVASLLMPVATIEHVLVPKQVHRKRR